ncbi:MAG: RagB/SusD family nutrient uptake outer membrane protein [Labilibaculum sp.]|nr:RagB/SusD family nutrient uptake outer membrane protein [Labilibaculum sp.]
MKNILLGILIALAVSACSVDDFLDVKPIGKIIPSTVSDFDLLLNDYQMSQSALYNLKYIDPDVYLTDESFTDLWYEPLKQTYLWADDYYGISGGDDSYIRSYKNIMTFNTILADIDNADLEDAADEDRIRIKGEALGGRALDLFLLAEEYGPAYSDENLDLPCVIMPLEVNLGAKSSRSTVKEVYNRILEDTKEAMKLLDQVAPVHDVTNNLRPGRAAIRALLAEVYLSMGDFQQSAQYADETLSMYNFVYNYVSDLQLKTTDNKWDGVVDADGNKIFWRLTDTKSTLWSRYFFRVATREGVHSLYHPDLVAIYAEDYDNDPNSNSDQRWNFFASKTGYGGGTDYSPYYIFASDVNRQISVGMSVPLILLNAAESKARLGNDDQGALDALNILLRNRIVGFTDLTLADVPDVLALVKKERRKEFTASGLNVINLKRYHAYGDAVDTYTRTVFGETYTLEPGSNKYIVPIYQKALNQNPNISAKPY